MKRLAAAVAMVVASASMASASGMSIFTAPDKTYTNTVDTPCIFYGPGNSGCNKDPSGWLTPAGPTNGSFNPLTQTYAGTDYTEWNSVVGSTFVLGFDVNDTSTPQTLAQMRIEYFSAGNALLGADEFAPATLTPSNANGTGWADYVLSLGCSGTTVGSGLTETCVPSSPNGPTYTPFVAPANTAKIVFSFALTGGNDGSDKIFAIPVAGGVPTQNCTIPGSCDPDLGTAVPEPSSMMLLGSGLVFWAGAARRRFRK